MSKSIADLIADLRRELAEVQKQVDALSHDREQAEDAEQVARNRRAQIAREIEELQEAQNRLSGV
jgi:DNA-binding transcriptional MerR regulator